MTRQAGDHGTLNCDTARFDSRSQSSYLRAMVQLAHPVIALLIATLPGVASAEAPQGRATALTFGGDAIILATEDGLWRSKDGGADWTRLPSDLGSKVEALATHPDRPDRLLAALENGGVALSEDGGSTWTQVAAGLPELSATAIAIASQNPDTVYVALAGDGLWQSLDAGATWTLAMDRPWLEDAERDLLALASVNSPSGMGGIWVYAGTEVGLTRVPDCFCRWQDVHPGNAMDALVAGVDPAPVTPLAPNEAVLDLALAPAAPEVIQAATPSGLWRSEDAGVNWVRTRSTAALALAVDPANPDHIVAATEGGILTSHDGGLTWAELDA